MDLKAWDKILSLRLDILEWHCPAFEGDIIRLVTPVFYPKLSCRFTWKRIK